MYEKIEVCPVCKNTHFTNFLICTDHSITGESFALTECSKCHLVFTNPRPVESHLGKYYESDNYISHSNKPNSLINVVYKIVRSFTIQNKIQLINKHITKGALLDYGCGTGDFALACKKKGWDVLAYEPNELARSQASSKGLNVVQDLKIKDTKVDVITAWHVIEHVSDLRKTIKSLKKILNDNGFLIIAVPNHKSFDAQHYRENWAAYDVPRHLYHFSKESFGKLVAKSKLKIVDTLPMKFDAYYVSLLSEKYKGSKKQILNALKIGFTSNKLAKKSGEYSSLIYVLKK